MCSWVVDVLSNGSNIIAIVAVLVSIATAKSQEKHNRNSVRPILNITVGDYEDDIYVRVENNGVGPACIKAVKCIYQDADMRREESNLVEVLPAGLVAYYTDFLEDFSGRAIAPQQSLMLLQKIDPSEEELFELRQHLKNCYVEIVYTDIYKKEFEPERRSLDFFGRTLPDVDVEMQILVKLDV